MQNAQMFRLAIFRRKDVKSLADGIELIYFTDTQS